MAYSQKSLNVINKFKDHARIADKNSRSFNSTLGLSMSEQQMILNDTFWKFLVSMEELKVKKDLALFCSSLDVDEKMLLEFKNFLERFEVLCVYDDHFIYPLKDKCRIKIDLSLSEWLALQATFQKEEDLNHYHQKIIKNKIKMIQQANEHFSLFRKQADQVFSNSEWENLKKKIDYEICHKHLIKLHFLNTKECTVFPHRLIFIDGILCLVGENIQDKTLVYFGVEDLESIDSLKDQNEHHYDPNLSQIEINEFIIHLRTVNDKDERLVLKIYNQYDSDLLPAYHFLGNPFVTSNSEGDMIWAATIEICDDLFEWLFSMKDRVEILDPGHVRKEFAHYCEFKKGKGGFKKAS